MRYSLLWLPEVLRDAGLNVTEIAGWQTRGHGDEQQVLGVLCHHTCGPLHGNIDDLNVLIIGRPDLAGPLCQLGLGRDGTYFMICAGKGWHAGGGYWQGIVDGNAHMIGIEAENTGLPNDYPWPEVQLDAYARGCAAILEHIGAKPIMCAGHKEYAPHRKDDPDFDMNAFRARVADLMGHPAPAPHPEPPPAPPPSPIPGTGDVKVVGVAPDTLAFRSAPYGEQRGSLPEGTVVLKVGSERTGHWTQVKTPAGFVGWVATRFLKPATGATT